MRGKIPVAMQHFDELCAAEWGPYSVTKNMAANSFAGHRRFMRARLALAT
jgi:hypothetical protein